MVEIRTERLVLRPLDNRDAAALQKAANDRSVSDWIPLIPHPYNLDDAKAFITESHRSKGIALGIFFDNQFIGCVELSDQLGYWLDKEFRDQGFATEACFAVLRQHFQKKPDAAVRSNFLKGNDASHNVLHKLGFKETGAEEIELSNGEIATRNNLILTPEAWLTGFGFPIYTDRLTLRPLGQDDWDELQFIAGNSTVAPMLQVVTSPWPESAVKRWIKSGQPKGETGFRLGIYLDGGRLVGAIGLGAEKTPSVFYFVSEQFWGRGIATEALRALLAFSFNRFGISEVVGDSFTDNPASMKVMENCGFEKNGEGMGTSAARLEPAPVFLYRLTRTKFESLL